MSIDDQQLSLNITERSESLKQERQLQHDNNGSTELHCNPVAISQNIRTQVDGVIRNSSTREKDTAESIRMHEIRPRLRAKNYV